MSAMLYLQNKSDNLYQQLLLLSQMNGKAIENKTDDAKVSWQKGSDTNDNSCLNMFFDRDEFYF